MFTSIFEAFGNAKEKEQKEFFNYGKRAGLEEGIKIGLQRHFEATSELSDEEHELLIKFLVRHNFVLCVDQDGGFRIRRNDRLNPQIEKKVLIVDPDYKEGEFINTVTVSLVKSELMAFEFELMENTRRKLAFEFELMKNTRGK